MGCTWHLVWTLCPSIFCLFAIGQIIMNLASWLYGVAVLKTMKGCTQHLVWTLCANIFLLRQKRQFNCAKLWIANPTKSTEDTAVIFTKPAVPLLWKYMYNPEALLAANAG